MRKSNWIISPIFGMNIQNMFETTTWLSSILRLLHLMGGCWLRYGYTKNTSPNNPPKIHPRFCAPEDLITTAGEVSPNAGRSGNTEANQGSHVDEQSPFSIGSLLLMEEILHHLRCIKPCKKWDFNYQPNWCITPDF